MTLSMMPVVAKNNVIFHLVDSSKFSALNDMKQILVRFAEKIDIINMNNIPMEHTINLGKVPVKKIRRSCSLQCRGSCLPCAVQKDEYVADGLVQTGKDYIILQNCEGLFNEP